MAKRKGSNKLAILMILVAVTAVLYWFSQDNSGNRYSAPPPKSQEKFITEKTGAGTIADFTAAAVKVHNAVDSVLATNKITISSQQDQKREVPRQAVEGLIRWHARQLAVTLPDNMPKERFRDLLTLASAGGGEVLEVASDQYQGQNATRYDVGIRDKLAGDTVTLITDKIYVVSGKKQGPAKAPDTKDRAPAKERAQLAIVSSLAWLFPFTRAEAYGASKAALSLAMTSFGVPAGAARPCQAKASKPFRPCSLRVGISSKFLTRLALAMPRARSLPAAMNW